MLPGFMGKPMKVPVPSTWKLVDGTWYWYVDPESLRMTPFGKLNPGSPGESAPRPQPSPFPRFPPPSPTSFTNK